MLVRPSFLRSCKGSAHVETAFAPPVRPALAAAFRFWWNESTGTARGVLYASLVHLPLLLAAMTWDHFRLLN